MNITFKALELHDEALHQSFIYLALWDPPNSPRRPRSVLNSPHVAAYFKHWGRQGDTGFIAYVDGIAAGFIQVRVKYSVTQQYEDFPELAIAVLPQYQGLGLGYQLYQRLVNKIQALHPGIRLGVHPENTTAINFYKKQGFQFYAYPENAYPQMVVEFDAINK